MKPAITRWALLPFLLLTSCQVIKPYAPPAVKAVVEEVEIVTEYFEGRVDYYAVVKGRLSSSVALLVDAKQSRDGQMLYIEVREQTPRGAVAMPTPENPGPPTFQSRLPIETLGLLPGSYIVDANGIQVPLEIEENPEKPPAPDPAPAETGNNFAMLQTAPPAP